MTIMESFLGLFMNTDTEQFSDEELSALFRKITKQNLEDYKTYHWNQAKESDKNTSIDRLLLLRLFADEIWQIIGDDEFSKKEDFKFRISAIGKLFLRILINTDENICLFQKKYGISIISNLRMILECYTFAKYIWDTGEDEAKRFQDYAFVQEYDILKKGGIKEKFSGKYEESFYSINGWISLKKYRTLTKLIQRLNNDGFTAFYKFSCHYVHASPYSIQMLMKMNRNLEDDTAAYFPFGFEDEIRINEEIIFLFIELVVTNFMQEEQRSLCLETSKIIRAWM